MVETEEWSVPVAVKLAVKNTYKAPVLKLAKTSMTLNNKVSDYGRIALTVNPANYELENPTIRIIGEKVNGELSVCYDDGNLYVATTNKTPKQASYKVYVGAEGIKEVALTVKVMLSRFRSMI